MLRGSVVEDGEAVLRVGRVGPHTAYGRLALELAQGQTRPTPLQLKLGVLAGGVARLAYWGAGLIALLSLLRTAWSVHGGVGGALAFAWASPLGALQELVGALTLGVIVIVVAVPEGLPTMIALVLALNMRRLLQAQVLVRRLLGIETAGSLSLLLVDKTGTLTRGAFEPRHLLLGGHVYGHPEQLPPPVRVVVGAALQEGTPSTRHPATGQLLGGNGSDHALLAWVRTLATVLPPNSVRTQRLVLFNSLRKWAGVELQLSAEAVQAAPPLGALSVDGLLSVLKGAPEQLLPRCTRYLNEHAHPQPLSPAALGTVEAAVAAASREGHRVIALALGPALPPSAQPDLPPELLLLGVLVLADELRPGTAQALERCASASIQTVMVTGDKRETAVAVARALRLLQGEDEARAVLTSQDLRTLDDAQLAARLPALRVVARAVPSDKSRLVRVGQRAGHVVGMTGDGVNDSAALKLADVGFAMGSGTEVCKEAADIVLLDDAFASVLAAVLYGRTIFRSIRKFLTFQTTVNLASFLVVLLAPLLVDASQPLSLVQLLWVNLVMDALAALMFGGEPPQPAYLAAPPTRRGGPLISLNMWSAIVLDGLWLFLLSLYFLGSAALRAAFSSSEAHATGYFCLFILATQCNAWNCRTKRLSLLDGLADNRQFALVFLLVLAVQGAMVHWGGAWLRTVPLTGREWLLVALLALTMIPLDLLRKLLLLPLLRRRLSPALKARIKGLTAFEEGDEEEKDESAHTALNIR